MDELVERSKKGYKNAFTSLIVMLEDDLYKIARMRLECQDDINEAVQETIIEAFKSLKHLRKTEYFKTWLIKILINKCNKIYKKYKRFNILENKLELQSNLMSHDEEQKDDEIDFFILIKGLSYDEKISLILYYLEGFTTKEIGLILKVPESTIRSRNSRALQKLRKIYEGGRKNG